MLVFYAISCLLLVGQASGLFVSMKRSQVQPSTLFGSNGGVSASLTRSRACLRSLISRSRLFSSVNWKKFDVALRLRDVRLLENAARQLSVPAPLNAPRIVWTLAWRLQSFMLPILHFFDRSTTVDTCLNLAVLWWKAIAGDGVCYDLLPSITRWIVASPLRFLYPRLHHQNVAMRTQFLDRMLIKELHSMPAASSTSLSDKTAVIVLGAGFDSRSLRFLNNRRIGRQRDSPVSSETSDQLEFYEVDLPDVIEQKKDMLGRYERRNRESRYPTLVPADLNNVVLVQEQLTREVFKASNPSEQPRRFKSIIIMVEAVLMYLDKEQVSPLLQTVITLSKQYSGQISFAFSDRIPGVCEQIDRSSESIADNDLAVTDKERELVKAYLKEKVDSRMELVEWIPKPGRARHQGLGHIKSRRKESMDELYPRVNII